MVAYSLLAFVMLNGVAAFILRFTHKEYRESVECLQLISRIILYPAVFLLAIGIFVGAVWANVSWGRYWGWDPKEVWALITMLVYALALHPASLHYFRRPLFFHLFSIVAFLTVLITYFGVNFLLGGMHSYAGSTVLKGYLHCIVIFRKKSNMSLSSLLGFSYVCSQLKECIK